MSILEARRRDRSSTRWEALIENALQPMYAMDATSMRYLGANAAGLLHLNCTAEQLIASGTDELQPEGEPAGFGEHRSRLLAGEPVVTFKVTQQREDNILLSFWVTWQLLTTNTGSVILSVIGTT